MHIDLATVLGQATQTCFLKAKLLLDHSERVLELGANMCLGCFDQILQPVIGGICPVSTRLTPHINLIDTGQMPMDLRKKNRLERIDFLMSTNNYVCLLRKRSASVT